MEFLTFDAETCTLCGRCVDACPFGALTMEKEGIVVGDGCRMCGLCVRQCPVQAIRFEQRANEVNKEDWKDFLVVAEQDAGRNPSGEPWS